MPRRSLSDLPPLDKSCHTGPDEGACVMEAVSYVAGEPWSDKPACACSVIGGFLRGWNDKLPNVPVRDRLLRPLVERLTRSRADEQTTTARGWTLLDWMIREAVPLHLENAGLAGPADRLAKLNRLTARPTRTTLKRVASEADLAIEEIRSAVRRIPNVPDASDHGRTQLYAHLEAIRSTLAWASRKGLSDRQRATVLGAGASKATNDIWVASVDRNTIRAANDRLHRSILEIVDRVLEMGAAKSRTRAKTAAA